MPGSAPVYKRVLVKLSGEALSGEHGFGFHVESCNKIAASIRQLIEAGMEVALVIGAGNIFRGWQGAELGLARPPADHIGMLGTIMNGIAFSQVLRGIDCPARVLSALGGTDMVDPFRLPAALQALAQGEVVICAGGTGHPFFTTDTASALRASQLQAEVLLKATKVDGVYDKDPKKDPAAKRYDRLSYEEVLVKRLAVMDSTAISLCRENQIPIKVFALDTMWEAVTQTDWGTLVTEG